MRVAIMGSGSLGGIIGGRLAASGTEVMFIARGAHLEALKTNGLKVLSSLGDLSLPTIHATDDPTGEAPADIVLFTVKGPDTETAADIIRPLVGPHTGIVSLQNGVSGIRVLAKRYGESAVLPGATMISGLVEGPGVVRHVGSADRFTIGEWDGTTSSRALALQAAARKAALTVELSDAIHSVVWSKFVAMASMSAVTCLTRSPVRTCATAPELREFVTDAMQEVMAVAKARGVEIDPDLPAKIIAGCQTVDPNWKTSMCNDLEAGKPIEIETISGDLHHLGQVLGVPTPIHSLAFRALRYYASPQRKAT
jgi:2-dehydropantoate 2-reductase